ncbi:diguanylate cyclase [Christensenellaceae bacterium OttesenSCG-928-L17]|nr:diguanylate cyclase [Christensenellaceae bacterium OttesenSCG-928-L17]
MYNVIFAIVYTLILLFTAYYLRACLRRRPHKRLDYNLIFFMAVMVVRQAQRAMIYAFPVAGIVEFLYTAGVPLADWGAVALLLLCVKLYGYDSYHSPVIVSLLGIIPVITTILGLTNARHFLLINEFTLTSQRPMMTFSMEYGVWYWVHIVYFNLLLVVALCMSIIQYHKLQKIYLPACRVVIGTVVATITGEVLIAVQVLPRALDFGLFGLTAAALLLNGVINRNQGMDSLSRAKDALFNEMGRGTWVLDEDGQVIDRNLAAEYMQFFSNIQLGEPDFSKIETKTREISKKYTPFNSGGNSVDYWMAFQGNEHIINLHHRHIYNKRGQMMGKIVVCEDVTRDRETMQELKKRAGIDAVTGLLTGARFARRCAQMDTEKNLPLCVIAGDIDNLSAINDNMGRGYGNAMLSGVADILQDTAPPSACIAWVDGDGFRLLIPRCTLLHAQELLSIIRLRIARIDKGSPVAMSFGVGLKMNPRENLNDAVRAAEADLQRDKSAGAQKEHTAPFYKVPLLPIKSRKGQ